MRIQNYAERIAHAGIALTLGVLALSACAPTVDPDEAMDAAIDSCTVEVTEAFVSEHGELTADAFDLIREKCTEQVKAGEWP